MWHRIRTDIMSEEGINNLHKAFNDNADIGINPKGISAGRDLAFGRTDHERAEMYAMSRLQK